MSGWPGSESADFGSDDHIDHIFRTKIEAPLLGRIEELEAIVRQQKSMLDEIAEAAGFDLADAYSAASIIASLAILASLKQT